MRAFDSIANYDFGTWMIGIFRSFLSGGATALCTGAGGALVGIPGKQAWELMGINFILMGLYRMGEFLQLHGAPDQLQKALDTAAKESQKAVNQANVASDAVQEAKSVATTDTEKN